MAHRFPIEYQQEKDWCWNAVAVSVERYFYPQSKMTQKTFARQALGPFAETDQALRLSVALGDLKLPYTPRGGFLSFEEIRTALDANLPVCATIMWKAGDYHCVVISGYRVSPGSDPQVYVSDPRIKDPDPKPWPYDVFLSAYSPPSYAKDGGGTWVATCLVEPPQGAVNAIPAKTPARIPAKKPGRSPLKSMAAKAAG